MALVATLAGRLARVALVGPAIARLKRRATRTAIGGMLVLVFGALGLAYLLIALRYELERQIGPIWAPVAIGGVLCLFAGIAYLALLRPRRSEVGAAEAQEAAIRDKLVGPARRLEGQVAEKPLQTLALAVAVGFAAAYLLRLLRSRERGPAEPPAPAMRRGDGRTAEAPPPWTREFVLREAERRRANGQGR